MPFFALCLAALLVQVSALPTLVSINNSAPRLDSTGIILDGHDCSLRQLTNGSFVLHTIEYGLCVAPSHYGCDQLPSKCGFSDTHNITTYLTEDLTSGSWRKVGDAFPLSARPPGLIYRPDAIFCPNTNLWVLMYDYVTNAWATDQYITSVSPSPFGPFTDFQVSNITNSSWNGGDFHLFVDEASPGDGYIVWTGGNSAPGLDHKIRINKLTPDFRDADPSTPGYMFDEEFTEAPSVFFHHESKTWYALFGHCCCFCGQGSGLLVHTAPHPLGPWTLVTHQEGPSDISCQAAPPNASAAATPLTLFSQGSKDTLGFAPTPGQGCLYGGSTDVAVTRSQQDFLATLPDGNGGHTYLYLGSRWMQSPDGLKGHEPQYVFPLTFFPDGSIAHITWNASVSFMVDVAQRRE